MQHSAWQRVGWESWKVNAGKVLFSANPQPLPQFHYKCKTKLSWLGFITCTQVQSSLTICTSNNFSWKKKQIHQRNENDQSCFPNWFVFHMVFVFDRPIWATCHNTTYLLVAKHSTEESNALLVYKQQLLLPRSSMSIFAISYAAVWQRINYFIIFSSVFDKMRVHLSLGRIC